MTNEQLCNKPLESSSEMRFVCDTLRDMVPFVHTIRTIRTNYEGFC